MNDKPVHTEREGERGGEKRGKTHGQKTDVAAITFSGTRNPQNKNYSKT
jgi:hypothetical protein